MVLRVGLTIRTSNRLELLAEELAQAIQAHPLGPLSKEIILVPGQGMARWLRMALARVLKIAAGFEMPFPGAYLEQLTESASDSKAWTRDALTFRIHRQLQSPTLQQALGPAWRYCQDDSEGHKRLQLAARIAQCFDDYQLYRPELLQKWQEPSEPATLNHEAWQAQL